MKLTRGRGRVTPTVTLGKQESRLWFARELSGSRYGTARDAANVTLADELRATVCQTAQGLLRETGRSPVEVVVTDAWDRHALAAEVASTYRDTAYPTQPLQIHHDAFGQMAWPNPTAPASSVADRHGGGGAFASRGVYVVVGRGGEIDRASTLAEAKRIAWDHGSRSWRGATQPGDGSGDPIGPVHYSSKDGDLLDIYVLTEEHPTVTYARGKPPISIYGGTRA